MSETFMSIMPNILYEALCTCILPPPVLCIYLGYCCTIFFPLQRTGIYLYILFLLLQVTTLVILASLIFRFASAFSRYSFLF